MRCSYPQYRWLNGEKLIYPCGHCNACLKSKQTEKALRGYLESLTHEDNCFLTVTYSDEFLPKSKNGLPSLRRRDFDNLIKRIRAMSDSSVQVLGSGEYSKVGRPHYHICLFGISSDFFINHTKHWHNSSHGIVLEDYKSWSSGGCLVAPFDIKTAFYASKYLVKSTKNKEEYNQLGIEPEFIYQSRRPALGKKYAILHKNRLLKDGFIRCNGRKYKLPRYFVDKVINDGSDEYQDLKERLFSHATLAYSRYRRGLANQYKNSKKHFFQQISEEAEAREKTLMKGK